MADCWSLLALKWFLSPNFGYYIILRLKSVFEINSLAQWFERWRNRTWVPLIWSLCAVFTAIVKQHANLELWRFCLRGVNFIANLEYFTKFDTLLLIICFKLKKTDYLVSGTICCLNCTFHRCFSFIKVYLSVTIMSLCVTVADQSVGINLSLFKNTFM